jgi:hypothetical protein
VLCMRLRSSGRAGEELKPALDRILSTFQVNG